MKKILSFAVITLVAVIKTSAVFALSTSKPTIWSQFTDYAGSGLVLAGAIAMSYVIFNTLKSKTKKD